MKPMQKMEKDSRKDTSISLYPLDFDEAIEMLVQEPKQKDSQTEDSCNTTEPAPESETSKPQTSRRRKPRDDSA